LPLACCLGGGGMLVGLEAIGASPPPPSPAPPDPELGGEELTELPPPPAPRAAGRGALRGRRESLSSGFVATPVTPAATSVGGVHERLNGGQRLRGHGAGGVG